MTERLSPEQRSANMRAVRGKNTKPEMLVRRIAHRLGYRYRLHVRNLPGKPDLVFPARRKVIFVHGCFWHGHSCPRGSRPASNAAFWREKLNRNVRRDAAQVAALLEAGWATLVIWECETKSESDLGSRLQGFLG